MALIELLGWSVDIGGQTRALGRLPEEIAEQLTDLLLVNRQHFVDLGASEPPGFLAAR